MGDQPYATFPRLVQHMLVSSGHHLHNPYLIFESASKLLVYCFAFAPPNCIDMMIEAIQPESSVHGLFVAKISTPCQQRSLNQTVREITYLSDSRLERRSLLSKTCLVDNIPRRNSLLWPLDNQKKERGWRSLHNRI